MKKTFLILFVILIGISASFFLRTRDNNVDPNARTYYRGSVEIDFISLEEIQKRLETQGCTPPQTNAAHCVYKLDSLSTDDPAFLVHPRGYGFGPVSFIIGENRVEFQKDIFGAPNDETYRAEVRDDLRVTVPEVIIQERSWSVETEYPVTWVY